MMMPPFSRLRRVSVGVVVLAALALGGIDAGSVALTRMALPDDAREAGHTATELVSHAAPSQPLADAALAAAREDARTHGVAVRRRGFTIYPDGRVTLTAVKEAPTLLLGRVGALRHFTEVRTTVTVEPLPY